MNGRSPRSPSLACIAHHESHRACQAAPIRKRVDLLGKIVSLLRNFSAAAHCDTYGDPLIHWPMTRAGGYKDCVSVRTFLPRTLEGDEAELTRVANPPPLSALD